MATELLGRVGHRWRLVTGHLGRAYRLYRCARCLLGMFIECRSGLAVIRYQTITGELVDEHGCIPPGARP